MDMPVWKRIIRATWLLDLHPEKVLQRVSWKPLVATLAPESAAEHPAVQRIPRKTPPPPVRPTSKVDPTLNGENAAL